MTPSDLLALARSPAGKKMIRYSATSVICVILSSAILAFLVGLLQWGAFWADVTACAISTVPSYLLNRRWAWGMAGKGHFWKEVVPFWVMAFIGLAFSLWAATAAQAFADHHRLSRLPRTAMIDGAFVGAFGVLWIGKFLILNKMLFTDRGGVPATIAGADPTPDPTAVAG